MELPWRNNKKGLSCVPAGTYLVKIRKSPKFGFTYWVTNINGREFILIHGGNFAGDVTKGWKSNVLGCIELGKRFGTIGNQRAILTSKPTVRKFKNHMQSDDFMLTIIGNMKEAA